MTHQHLKLVTNIFSSPTSVAHIDMTGQYQNHGEFVTNKMKFLIVEVNLLLEYHVPVS